MIVPRLTYPHKVKARWSQVVGDGQSWKATIARISLRECLRKEPSANEVNDFIAKRSASEHEKLARDLEDDVDSAFSDGKEVCLLYLSRRTKANCPPAIS